MISRYIIISGKVQGVFFRKNARQKAQELNLVGWVKNTADYNVEVFVQGIKKNVDDFIDWCRQGPPKAKVENIFIEEKPRDNGLKEFTIVYED